MMLTFWSRVSKVVFFVNPPEDVRILLDAWFPFPVLTNVLNGILREPVPLRKALLDTLGKHLVVARSCKITRDTLFDDFSLAAPRPPCNRDTGKPLPQVFQCRTFPCGRKDIHRPRKPVSSSADGLRSNHTHILSLLPYCGKEFFGRKVFCDFHHILWIGNEVCACLVP